MTTWNVTAGRWRMTDGTTTREVELERSAALPVEFAPGRETRLDFELVKAGTPVETRPDLGIGRDDVVRRKGALEVTVHSLGASDIAGGTATVVDAAGRVLASVPIPALAAPRDLLPHTTTVRLALPKGAAAVRVALSGGRS